jgi:hypothetical protein
MNMNDDINNMNSTRAYKFRIYPDAKRQSEIDERLVLAQQFYNNILEKLAQAIYNASWNRFIHMLSYKAESAGMKVIDRDILNRAREKHFRSNASGDATSTIQQVPQIASMNQEHTLQPLVAVEAHGL